MLGDSIRRRRGKVAARPEPERKPSRRAEEEEEDRPPFLWGRFALAALGTVAALFMIGYLFASRVLYPPVEGLGAAIVVPDLTGAAYGDARLTLEEAGLVAGETTELPHPEAARGTVVAQSPLGGQGLRPGGAVRLAVSAGPARLRVPDLLGFPAGTARDVLERAGLDVTVEEREDPAPQGRVLAMAPSPGNEVPLPFQIRLTVSAGPPEEGAGVPDTLPVRIPPAVIPPLP